MNLTSKCGSPSKKRIFSLRSCTSSSTSRTLFCVISSPCCGGMRNRIVRAPASLAVKCTFTVVGSPSLVSATSCELRMRPESSTLSGTRRAAEAVLRHDDVDREVRALQDLARRADAADLDVAPERLASDADGEDRHLAGAQAEQRFLNRGLLGVGAVGHHHEARRAAGP